MQSGPGRLSARPRETVDHVPQGEAQLFSPGRFTLLLQPLTRHERHHPHAGTGRHPRPLLHATQQVNETHATTDSKKCKCCFWSHQLCPFSVSPPASPALRCVCSTCNSSLMSSRVGLKSRNPPSPFGLPYRTRQCLNRGIVMQSVCEQKLLQCCCPEHLSHVYSSLLTPSAISSHCQSHSNFAAIQQIF